MKRRKFLKHIEANGGEIVGEGKRHTRVRNIATDAKSFVPRHAEIKPGTMRAICEQLGIPLPSEK